MRSIFYALSAMLLFAACSTPKYAYYFDHHNYSGTKKNAIESARLSDETRSNPLTIDQQTLTASASPAVVALPSETQKTSFTETDKKAAAARLAAMSKSEKKELKKELKQYLKNAKKSEVKSPEAAKALDKDAKMAIIFGGIGVIFLLFPGEVFLVLAAISLIIGFVFFIKWISRQ